MTRHLSFLIVFLFWANLSFEQIYRDKEDPATFKFQQKITNWPTNCQNGACINNAEISVLWSVMGGHPKEDYKFYWEFKCDGGLDRFVNWDGFNGSDAEDLHTVRQYLYSSCISNVLRDHPDLLKEYESLTPKFDLKISGQIVRPDINFYGHVERFDKIVSSNGFNVEKSGQRKTFSVPSIPDGDWAAFFSIPESNDRWKDLEKDFKHPSAYLNIIMIEFVDIDWGEATLSHIANTYVRREIKRLKEEKSNSETEEEGEDDWALKNDDYKESVTKEEISEMESEEDDWALKESELDAENTDDWALVDNITEEDGDGGDWATSATGSGEYEIQYKDGKYGVVDPVSKRVLIPYKFDQIKSYSNGYAIVRLLTDTKTLKYEWCSNWSLDYYLEGSVNSSGEFVTEPRKILVSREHFSTSGLVLKAVEPSQIPNSASEWERMERERERREREAARREEERKRKASECREYRRAEVKRYEQEFINSGGTLE